jgi:hypothetical protein
LSRYVAITLELRSLDEVDAGLRRMGLTLERGRDRVMLEGSLECTGEPVDIRIAAGTLDAIEDFGFVREGGEIRLVCGELDADRLQRDLLVPLRAAVVQERIEATGMRVESIEHRPDGIRIVVSDDD